MSLLQPLELKRLLQQPDIRLDPIPLVNMVVIIGIFYVLSSRFMLAPGLSVKLGEGGAAKKSSLFEMPELEREHLEALPAVDVISVGGADRILYDGTFFTLGDLLRLPAPDSPLNASEERILLLKINRSAPVEVLMQVAAWARTFGYTRIQIAANEKPQAEDVFQKAVQKSPF